MSANYWDRTLRYRLSRRRAIVASGAAAVTAAILAACGGSSGSSGGSNASGGASGLISPPVDTTKAAKRGGDYLSSRTSDIDQNDPHFTTQAAPGTAQTYSRLFRRKPGVLGPQPFEFITDLADSYEFSPDKLQMTVKLKTSKWHPVPPVNGRPVDAQDVAYTWKRLESVGANRSLLAHSVSPAAPIDSVTALDDKTVQLKFAFPSAAIIPLLSGNISGYYWMLPRESENQYDVRRVNIGSGPFWVSDYKPSTSLTLKRNDGWYDAAKIFIDNLQQPIVPEYTTGLAQFKVGGIYGSTGVGGFVVKPDDILQTKKDVPILNLFLNDPASQGNIIFFGWNPSFGNGTAFRDKRLRQALSMSIDRDLWIDTFYNVDKFKAAGIPMTTAWNSALTTNWPGWWLDPRGKELGPDAKNYQYNPAEAKKLIAAAGFANGIELKAQYPQSGYSAEYVKMSETIQGFAKAVDVTLTTAPVSFTTDWRPKIAESQGDFEGISFRPDASGGLPDLVEQNFSLFHFQGGANYTGFFSENSSFQKGDPRLNDLLSKARAEFDEKKRIAALQDLQKIIADEQYVIRFPGSSNSFAMAWPVIGNANVFNGDLAGLNEWIDPTKAPIGKA